MCFIFLLASVSTAWARAIRQHARRTGELEQISIGCLAIARTLLKVALASAVVTAYPLGLSFALRSPERELGLTPLPYMALLATGSLAMALLVSGGVLTVHRQWLLLFRAEGKYYWYAALTAGAHYGGIINAFASGVLTTAVSWLLGTTSQLWTYFWGLVTGEFRGAPRRAYFLLLAGSMLFAAGIVLLRWALVRA